MIISVINHSHTLSDEAVQEVIRAINRQIAQDFQPYWSFGATLRLEGAIGVRPDTQRLSDMRDAVQTESYAIDAVEVSNFVLPSYFSPGEQLGRRMHPDQP